MRNRYIGCATDAKFVEPTAVLLSTIDLNGHVPDATIVVAGLQLNEEHRHVISVGAGSLADRLRFIEIDPDTLTGLGYGFTGEFPPIVMGRLLIADAIREDHVRLLTLDSDMIVNASLEPLFELDMENEYFAAVHDFPRHHDGNYFNSGMTLSDLDTYKFYDVSRRCFEWLSENPQAIFPDQDALNNIVGDCWYRLDYCWNRYLIAGRQMKLHDFESARIAHFAHKKPWDHPDHPGFSLYNRYLKRLRDQLYPRLTGSEMVR